MAFFLGFFCGRMWPKNSKKTLKCTSFIQQKICFPKKVNVTFFRFYTYGYGEQPCLPNFVSQVTVRSLIKAQKHGSRNVPAVALLKDLLQPSPKNRYSSTGVYRHGLVSWSAQCSGVPPKDFPRILYGTYFYFYCVSFVCHLTMCRV